MKIFNQNIRKCNQGGGECDIKHARDEMKSIKSLDTNPERRRSFGISKCG